MEVHDKYSARRTVGILAVVCVVLQMALSTQISIGGGTVNFMLILTGTVALLSGSRAGCVAGFLAGTLYDFTMPVPAGLMMLILSVTGFILGSGERNRLAEQLDVSLKLFAIACCAVNLVYAIALLLIGTQSDILTAIFGHGVASILLDVIFALPFFYVLARADLGQGFARRPNSLRTANAKRGGAKRYRMLH